ncbi:sigma-54-dependent transcriptional regulator [Thiocapsa roseopersicina]|uniref:DNA-binding transcriptional response regulator, NtrC family, contains REC, AAA-type ATPase, and a Fis-type DNA-binding domains n=1 Tax=Thiocapsa roseopersicina TaxID=1058 RepID=A0A1H2ZA39_THIRO|nr:sigma-54 dependent transcriptional regulator [Thiocapsa roseopersicina]SDX14373.1 DNA-binding transcriptional response regulator, NtrC family, contains REC, AAA-type ATPase, and a Fis-type DNA-binding domains [Thiocapsa roseopersicina]
MNILIADDDPMQRELLQGFLERQGHRVLCAADGEQAVAIVRAEPVQLVLLDQRMPKLSGDLALAEMKALNPLIRAFMITGYGAVDTAVSVMKLGADEFLEKPLDLPSLLEKIQRVEIVLAVDEEVAAVEDALEENPGLPLRLIGKSPAMLEVLSVVHRVSSSPWNVLIGGETGTGKEMIARLIHLLGTRRDAPFIEVNCAAIPENLFESELFGHEKGAFTGAAKQRRGRFELAHGGTLFLDEVGELPLILQSKLLRALQEGRFTRVGGESDLTADVRIITASNRDLRIMVEDGRFREDLFFRLNVLEIDLPPLRQRREDIPALIEHFLARYADRPVRLSHEAMDVLVKYAYPGNVRELEHIVQRTLTLTRGGLIKPADLPPEVRRAEMIDHGLLQERIEAVEREMLVSALERTAWIQTRAAEMLGISERVLRYKMGKYGIRRREV